MAKLLSKITLSGILVCLFAVSAAASGALTPVLQAASDRYHRTGEDSLITAVIFLEQDRPAYLHKLAPASRVGARESQTEIVTSLETTNASRVQQFEVVAGPVLQQIHARHWIVPALTATIPVSQLHRLEAMPDISRVVQDAALELQVPVKEISASSMATGASGPLQQLGVPQLWAKGLTGEGRLVCSFDTGVEGSHPALAAKWRGLEASLRASWFSKVTPDALPSDPTGHGTHTMGVMVGSIDADSFGVAPQAQWICAGVIDQPGRPLSTTLSDIIEAFQWALNPDGDPVTSDDVPDVILNSWGIPKGLFEPCDNTFDAVIDAVEAAGIVTIFACGNEGPDPMTVRSPADRAATPLSSFTVGAVDDQFHVPDFSSRGPSSCDRTSIKPEVAAPGVLIRSSYKDGKYKSMSGTSMAAPFIAGLVALMRQYNPEATVNQIKNALINAAVDIGQSGEDNASGYGFVDAARVLEFLPAPPETDISITEMTISDDGLAMPGETFELSLELYNAAGNLESVSGTLVPHDSTEAAVQTTSADFFFGTNGTSASQTLPFTISLDTSLYHGQSVEFDLYVRTGLQEPFDTLNVALSVGLLPAGDFETVSTADIGLTISEFGQFGLAAGSLYDLNGDGLTFRNSGNLLYEGGLVVARNSLQMSTAVRDANAELKPSDFVPTIPAERSLRTDGSEVVRVVMRDYDAAVSIPIEVIQETITYNSAGDKGFVVLKYILHNVTAERLDGIRLGFLADFDLPAGNDTYHYDPERLLLVQSNGVDPAVALKGLANIGGFATLDNGDSKRGLSNDEWDSLLNQQSRPDTAAATDLAFVAVSRAMEISPNDSVEVAFAIVGGVDKAELTDNAKAAYARYHVATDVGDEHDQSLPSGFVLHQNYPNPFNPATTIAFQLPRASEVTLEIFNILGRRVVTLHMGFLRAGRHEVVWNATDVADNHVASGVYYYRLTAGTQSETRRMVVIK